MLQYTVHACGKKFLTSHFLTKPIPSSFSLSCSLHSFSPWSIFALFLSLIYFLLSLAHAIVMAILFRKDNWKSRIKNVCAAVLRMSQYTIEIEREKEREES